MKRILTILLASAMVLSFAACTGGNTDENKNETSSSSSTVQEATEAKDETKEDTDEEKATLEDYIKANESQFESVKEQFKDSLDFDVYAEGDTLVTEYTYLQDVGGAIDKEAMESALSQSSSDFLSMIDEMKDYTGISNPKLTVRYCNVDGTVLFEKTFDENYEPSEDEGSISGDLNSNNKYESLEDYIESDVVKNSFESAKEQYEGVMDVDILAEDNNLVYQYKYLEQIPEEALELTESTLKDTFSAQSSTFEYIVKILESSVEVEDPGVVIRVLNADETVIYEEQIA